MDFDLSLPACKCLRSLYAPKKTLKYSRMFQDVHLLGELLENFRGSINHKIMVLTTIKSSLFA